MNVAEAEALEFLAERARAVGPPLSLSERKLILQEVGFYRGIEDRTITNALSQPEWEKLVNRLSFRDLEALTLSEFLKKSHDGFKGQVLLQRTALCGVAFFSMCGAHIAGGAEFHVFGSTLVGCITALGGGTINALITGGPIGWMKNPTMLVVTIASALVGFYVWPIVEECFFPAQEIESSKLKEEEHSKQSALRYSLESIALGSLAVVGAQQGIIRGLHPLVSSCLGVTVALGGVMRDLMCDRDLTLGASTGCQSYGVASFSGAAVYVALRELHVWNCAGSTAKLLHGGIPIGARICCGIATVLGIRTAAWLNKPDGLLLTMDESAKLNIMRLETFLQYFKRGEPPKAS